jgi:tetratricopeptide (TPR) repeat protein
MATAGEAFQRGCSLFVDELFEEALAAFTQAIDLAPATKETAEYYVKRSACHAKLQNHTDAVADANAALALDPQNPRALLRKGYRCFYLNNNKKIKQQLAGRDVLNQTCSTACFSLDEFEAAKEAFQAGLAVEPSNSTFKTWLRKCEAELAGTLHTFLFFAAPPPLAHFSTLRRRGGTRGRSFRPGIRRTCPRPCPADPCGRTHPPAFCCCCRSARCRVCRRCCPRTHTTRRGSS